MATRTLFRWGFGLSLVVMAVAVYMRLQIPLQPSGSSETYCYQGIRTHANTPQPSANCFTISNGVFTSVFAVEPSSDVVQAHVRPGYAIPGLWDGHGHLLQYGEFLHSVDLFGSASFDEARQLIVEYLDTHEGVGTREDWVRGVGWDQMALGGMPTAEILEKDERLKGLYMMLDRVDVHCVWVSQAVLDLLPADIPDVPGGEVVRDPGMGVFCDNAMDLVMSLWPRPDKSRKTEFLKSAMASLHEVGLVGMHDAGVIPTDLALYEEMSETDEWTLRVYAMIECKERNTFCPDDAPQISKDNGMLNVRSVKLFADGALGSWGSAMLEPYSDRPDTTGSLLVNASTLTSLARSWSTAGYQVNIHAIGDLANRLAVDALEAALTDMCPDRPLADCQAERRFRIEHSQIIHPNDQARMRRMGIIPSIQPTHATSDMKYAELRLGKGRTSAEAYRMRSLLDLVPVLGSDFPVEPPNPFEGIYAAVARRSPHTGRGADGSSASWYPEEALSLDEALMGFTKGPAHGSFLEGKAGAIQEGAFADWLVLDEPIESIDIEGLRTVRVRETWVAGRRVYLRD
ncbi:Amidohydrolase [Pleurostoma richardsiae]|uniref:Amidohydrolase n=1 Tax=Pleurostoma richardsiae TaxID=41990 RepID=A0AA38VPS3_9PEZI|nr:Amidohydrolase [Pleurostoma richardsiae]